jgi:hypothetical protein
MPYPTVPVEPAESSHAVSSRIDALSARLTRLERENRRLRAAGMILLVLAGVLAVSGLSVQEPVIGAEAFTLVDKGGSLRAVFAMINNEPTLAMFDSGGGMRAGLSVVDDAPRLILYGKDGSAVWTAP